MPTATPRQSPPPDVDPRIALQVVDHIPAIVAYWDEHEICRFANRAYVEWFGKSREELLGTSIRSLLGPLYELNEPFLRRAYAGEVVTFERSIPRPDGKGNRESLATYTPDRRDGKVYGIFAHVADSTLLKDKERELERAIAERDAAAAKVRTLEGLLPICAHCKRIRTPAEEWVRIEEYVESHSNAQFTHGLCPVCIHELYPGVLPP
ncbi:MAG: PAS domain-containing protein [Gemmatimonadetes bacterium]|nr:PAS domain-containing protein [Gemmatimonadota bacterium]